MGQQLRGLELAQKNLDEVRLTERLPARDRDTLSRKSRQ